MSAMQHSPRSNRYRDSWISELDADRAGSETRVSGWVHRKRDHGGLVFIYLRDHYGLTQLVANGEHYVTDCLFAVPVVALAWWAARRIVRRLEHRRGTTATVPDYARD